MVPKRRDLNAKPCVAENYRKPATIKIGDKKGPAIRAGPSHFWTDFNSRTRNEDRA
jgi:hypothetical protein